MPRTEDKDRALMEALVRGESGALEAIIQKWERPLYHFAFRYLQNESIARDIVQETFVRVFTKKGRYRFEYPLASWIFTIAANLCKNRSRWEKRHPEVSLDSLGSPKEDGEGRALHEMLPSQDETPARKLEHDEALASLKRSVMTLPHDLRTAILLRHYQEFSYQEIADVVGCSIRGVETRLYRARKLLKERMGSESSSVESAQKKTTSRIAEVVKVKSSLSGSESLSVVG